MSRSKVYILPLLFLKRISDYWDWEYARALGASDSGCSRHASRYGYPHVGAP